MRPLWREPSSSHSQGICSNLSAYLSVQKSDIFERKKRSCECSFEYPETTNDETGELECLETAFDEVLIDDDLTKAGFPTP